MNRLIGRKKNILALSIKCEYMSLPILGMWFYRLSKLYSTRLFYTCLIIIKSNTCNTGKFKWTVGGRRVSFPIFFINCIKWVYGRRFSSCHLNRKVASHPGEVRNLIFLYQCILRWDSLVPDFWSIHENIDLWILYIKGWTIRSALTSAGTINEFFVPYPATCLNGNLKGVIYTTLCPILFKKDFLMAQNRHSIMEKHLGGYFFLSSYETRLMFIFHRGFHSA